jgi:hypothetical protein
MIRLVLVGIDFESVHFIAYARWKPSTREGGRRQRLELG